MTDNELEKAAGLSQKLGCALVDMGNIDRDISADNCERFEKIFGTDFYIGANREKTVSLGAVDSDAIDFSKIKGCETADRVWAPEALFDKKRKEYHSAARLPRVILISPPCSRQKKQAMFLYRLRCPLNA